MPICSRCGSEIEFRYIKGRCVPLHLYGGGCDGSARSDVYDYAGYSRSKESCCFLTNCPECSHKVYFIRHNGGSVWIDPPLGPPWYKHPCMDNTYVAAKGIRSPVVTESALAKFRQRDGLIIGIVKEAEASASKLCSLINIEAGKDKSIILLMKNNAGFLVGRLVVYDQRGKSVSWVEDDSYKFLVIARLKPQLVRPDSLALPIECPECTNKITAGEISEHLKQQHWFPQTIVLEKSPVQPPLPTRNRGVDRSTKVKAPTPQRICPNPSRWNDVFKQLVEYAEAHSSNPSQPPAPLILAGWAYSNDTEKMRRWRETVDWASANGCVGIVKGISDQDFYQVENPSSYSVGPMGGPCYRPWDFHAKVRPPEDELAKHLEYLTAHWADIAGSGLSTVTRPVAFTGKKARRLLVQAEGTAAPPVGRVVVSIAGRSRATNVHSVSQCGEQGDRFSRSRSCRISGNMMGPRSLWRRSGHFVKVWRSRWPISAMVRQQRSTSPFEIAPNSFSILDLRRLGSCSPDAYLQLILAFVNPQDYIASMTTLIATRLKALREERRLSQDDLARLFGFKDRQTVSAIETGERRLSADELLLAVEKLGASLDYFTNPFLLVGEGKFSWRQSKVSNERLNAFERVAGRWIAANRTLAPSVGKPPPNLRQSLKLTSKSTFAEAMAAGERFAADFELGEVPAQRLAEVMERKLGVLVLMVDAIDGISGAACRLPDLDAELINRHEVIGRRHFDLAHELFHILTWDTMPPEHVEEASERSKSRVEQLANNFASALLMPVAVLDRFTPAKVDNVKWLNDTAEALQVTATALKWRLVALERLDNAQANKISDADLRNNGRNISGRTPPPLYSKAFMEVIALAIDDGQVSARKAADLLDMKLEDLTELCATHGVKLSLDL